MTTSYFEASAFVWLNPDIDPKHVRHALDNLLYASRSTDNPLYYLALVDERIADVSRPSSSLQRMLEFNRFLVDDISDAYAERIKLSEGYDLNRRESKTSALANIHTIAFNGNIELLAWSWLYYHYVRIDINVRRHDFCLACAIGDRTLGRYQTIAINRLTERLYWHEAEAMKRLNSIY